MKPPRVNETARSSLRMIVAKDYQSGSQTAGKILAEKLANKPDLLLCAATGGSPTGTYEVFVGEVLARSNSGKQVSGKITILKLDEWGGLEMNDPATCEAYLQQKLIRPLQIPQARYVSFQSDAINPETECQRIQSWIETHGPIDVCVLGLGLNGHLGFNEPADELTAEPHVANLTNQSLTHPMLSATGHRPTHGLTLGMRDILASKSILLLVFGSSKSKQLEQLFTKGISSHFPASFLSLHADITCICDEAAAALLPQEVLKTDTG